MRIGATELNLLLSIFFIAADFQKNFDSFLCCFGVFCLFVYFCSIEAVFSGDVLISAG